MIEIKVHCATEGGIEEAALLSSPAAAAGLLPSPQQIPQTQTQTLKVCRIL